MAWAAEDLAAVERAIAKGERQVIFRDRSVLYRDVEELLKVRQIIKAALAGRTKQTLLVASTGWQR